MSTTIQEYSITDAALAMLGERYRDQVYDVATAAGLKLAREARAELRRYRTDLEAKRVEIKAPALERCRAIDAEAKRITAALLELEEPIDAQIKAEDNRKAEEKAAKERAEAERVAAIRKRIDDLSRWAGAMAGRSAAQIAEAIAKLTAMTLTDATFGEFLADGLATHGESLQRLTELHHAAVTAETERAELARFKAEQAERERTEQARRAEEERRRTEAEAESRRAIEEQERVARERIETEECKARQERERADEEARQARLAEQARQEVARQRLEAERQVIEEARRRERETAEAKAREEQRKRDAVLDARAMLTTFRERYGKLPEFAKVTKAIDTYLRAVASGRTAPGSPEGK